MQNTLFPERIFLMKGSTVRKLKDPTILLMKKENNIPSDLSSSPRDKKYIISRCAVPSPAPPKDIS